jgi:hypothetical protein
VRPSIHPLGSSAVTSAATGAPQAVAGPLGGGGYSTRMTLPFQFPEPDRPWVTWDLATGAVVTEEFDRIPAAIARADITCRPPVLELYDCRDTPPVLLTDPVLRLLAIVRAPAAVAMPLGLQLHDDAWEVGWCREGGVWRVRETIWDLAETADALLVHDRNHPRLVYAARRSPEGWRDDETVLAEWCAAHLTQYPDFLSIAPGSDHGEATAREKAGETGTQETVAGPSSPPMDHLASVDDMEPVWEQPPVAPVSASPHGAEGPPTVGDPPPAGHAFDGDDPSLDDPSLDGPPPGWDDDSAGPGPSDGWDDAPPPWEDDDPSLGGPPPDWEDTPPSRTGRGRGAPGGRAQPTRPVAPVGADPWGVIDPDTPWTPQWVHSEGHESIHLGNWTNAGRTAVSWGLGLTRHLQGVLPMQAWVSAVCHMEEVGWYGATQLLAELRDALQDPELQAAAAHTTYWVPTAGGVRVWATPMPKGLWVTTESGAPLPAGPLRDGLERQMVAWYTAHGGLGRVTTR